MSFTQVRVHLQIPTNYQQQPILSCLILNYGLVVNITGALVEDSTQNFGYFDLELRGNADQIEQGLNHLKTLGIKVIGKPHTNGDSWHY
jgi:ABC-type methionine transport system ATPase subunit